MECCTEWHVAIGLLLASLLKRSTRVNLVEKVQGLILRKWWCLVSCQHWSTHDLHQCSQASSKCSCLWLMSRTSQKGYVLSQVNYSWYKIWSKWSHKNVTHIASFLFLPFPQQIKEFLQEDGVTKAAFCHALGDLNQNFLNPFLVGKKQNQCGTIAYCLEVTLSLDLTPASSLEVNSCCKSAPLDHAAALAQTSATVMPIGVLSFPADDASAALAWITTTVIWLVPHWLHVLCT